MYSTYVLLSGNVADAIPEVACGISASSSEAVIYKFPVKLPFPIHREPRSPDSAFRVRVLLQCTSTALVSCIASESQTVDHLYIRRRTIVLQCASFEVSQPMRYGAVGFIDQSALSLFHSNVYSVTPRRVTKQSRQIGSRGRTSRRVLH